MRRVRKLVEILSENETISPSIRYISMYIFNLVYKWNSKYKEGLLWEEIDQLIDKIEAVKFNKDKFHDALIGCTCMIIDEKQVIYHHDIYNAIICGLENRGLNINEWD